MKLWSVVVLVFTVALGCGRGRSAAEPPCCGSENPESMTPAEASGQSPAACSRFEQENAATESNFEKGKRLIENCDEMCMKSESAGRERNEGQTLVREAARAGHLGAQSFYGRTLFGDLMTTGDEETLRDQYVDAVYFLALAARRGDEAVRSEIPQLTTLAVRDSTFSEPLAAPLSHLNEEWVKEAVKRAQSDARCFGKEGRE